MTKPLLRISVLLAMSSVATASHAGYKSDLIEVGINAADGVFWGQLGRARSGPNGEAIWCSVLYYTTGSPLVQCGAQDTATPMPNYTMCMSSLAAHADVLKTMTNHSFLQVSYDGSGNCTSIRVENGSQYPPMVP